MNTIYKKISLEPFKNRHNSKHWSIIQNGAISNNQVNWGGIPMDIVIDKRSKLYKLKDAFPLINGINKSSQTKVEYSTEKISLPYSTMISWYSFLFDFNRTTTFYKKCKSGVYDKWRDEDITFFDVLGFNDIGYYTTLSDTRLEDFPYGYIIGINKNADEFNRVFRVDGECMETPFIELVESVFSGKHKNTSIPYANIPIYIEEEIDDMGLLNSYSKLWEPSKTYRLGDIVIWYDENGTVGTYILKSGNGYELVELHGTILDNILSDKDGNTYIILESFTEGDEIFVNNKRVVLKQTIDGVDKYFLPVITHNAKYIHETDSYVFDTEKWELCIEDIDRDKNDEDIKIEAEIESRLGNVRRVKKSIDENGNTLPFIVDFDGNKDTQMVFSCGPASIKIGNDGTLYSDILNKVTLTSENGREGISTEFISGNTYSINKWYTTVIENNYDNELYLTDSSNSKLTFYKKVDEYEWVNVNFQKTEPTIGVVYVDYSPFAQTIEGEKLHLPQLSGNDVYNEYFIKYHGNDGVFYGLHSQKTEYVYDDNGELILNIDGTFKTETKSYFSDYCCKNIYATLYFSGITDTVITTNSDSSFDKDRNLTGGSTYITDKIDAVNYISTSFMNLSEEKFKDNIGNVLFEYTIGAIVEYNENNNKTTSNDIVVKNGFGIKYVENYKYELKESGFSYLPIDDENVTQDRCILQEINESDIEEDDVIIIVRDEEQPKKENLNKVYKIEYANNIVKYKRVVIAYNYFDIRYDENIVELISDDTNLPIHKRMSDVTYGNELIMDDNFLKAPYYKNELIIGVEDTIENIDVNIDRGMSSAFERLHILSEVKTFEDIENYRNNLFGL